MAVSRDGLPREIGVGDARFLFDRIVPLRRQDLVRIAQEQSTIAYARTEQGPFAAIYLSVPNRSEDELARYLPEAVGSPDVGCPADAANYEPVDAGGAVYAFAGPEADLTADSLQQVGDSSGQPIYSDLGTAPAVPRALLRIRCRSAPLRRGGRRRPPRLDRAVAGLRWDAVRVRFRGDRRRVDPASLTKVGCSTVFPVYAPADTAGGAFTQLYVLAGTRWFLFTAPGAVPGAEVTAAPSTSTSTVPATTTSTTTSTTLPPTTTTTTLPATTTIDHVDDDDTAPTTTATRAAHDATGTTTESADDDLNRRRQSRRRQSRRRQTGHDLSRQHRNRRRRRLPPTTTSTTRRRAAADDHVDLDAEPATTEPATTSRPQQSRPPRAAAEEPRRSAADDRAGNNGTGHDDSPTTSQPRRRAHRRPRRPRRPNRPPQTERRQSRQRRNRRPRQGRDDDHVELDHNHVVGASTTTSSSTTESPTTSVAPSTTAGIEPPAVVATLPPNAPPPAANTAGPATT